MNLLQRAASSIAELRGVMAHTQLARMAFEHKVTTPRRPPSGKVKLLVNGRAPVQLVDFETGLFLADRPTYTEARSLADQLERGELCA